MNNMLTVFPNFSTTDSIFQKMVTLGAPWSNEVGLSMDISFFTMYSGLKSPSFFVRSNVNSDSLVNSTLIAKTLWDMYGRNWSRLWDSYIIQYNPIDNYNLTESINRDTTNNRVIGRKGTSSSSVDGTDNSTTNDTGSSTLEHGHILDTTTGKTDSASLDETSSLEHGHTIDTTEENKSSDTVDATSTITFGHVVDTTGTTTRTEESDSTSELEHGETISRSMNLNDFTYAFNSTQQVATASQTQSGSENHGGTDTTTVNGTIKSDGTSESKETNSGKDETVSNSTTIGTSNTTVNQVNSGTDTTTKSTTTSSKEDVTDKQVNSGIDTTNTKDDSIFSSETKQTQSGTTTEDTTDDDTINEVITRNRSGNIGYNSYQQLLEQQFELWKWNFFFQVFEDCDKFLCLSVFDTCLVP